MRAPSATYKRLSVNIDQQTANILSRLAEDRRTSVTEIIRRAVTVYDFIEGQIMAGNHIHVDDGSQVRELHLDK